ncbi:hypothetical protein [Cephaloticoccus capnophilus]|uniref:hypothetical protein n=1 Tax=Cephaloticoccus capnophilus TaxID=1548208 RepID=UPI0012E750BA|nr:hypothetical protein [Cephaloticoccus capnophilus]
MNNNESYHRDFSSQRKLVLAETWWNRARGRYVRLLLLALTVCALWLTFENRWGSNFKFPTRYVTDCHYILAMMKLSKEGDLGLFTHITTKSLGAPFIGQLNDFPEVERVIVWLGGQIAKVFGLIPAANIMLLLSSTVAAFSFYSAARLWKISRLSSWIFAVVYAFLPQSQRSIDHIGVGFTGLLPLQLYCLWYIATVQKLSWGSFRLRLTFIISLLSGLLNIYWVFFFLQIYILALLCRLIKRRPGIIRALTPCLAASLVAGSVLASFIIYKFNYGANPTALVRSYADVETCSLKPIDLLIPNWISYLDISSRYYNGGKLDIGETWWGAYIGLCAIIGLAFLFLKSIQRQVNKRSPSLPFLTVLWIISYSSFGGIHALVSLLFNSYNIRSTNRYSEAIATIGLLYFTFKIHKTTRNWSLTPKALSFVFLATLALWDQSFKFYTFPFYDNLFIKERVVGDQDLVLKLEERLSEGAMIYTLPAFVFPEPFNGPGPNDIKFFLYNSIRPFLYSTKLRYSYGSNKGREGADWQLAVQELPPREMATKLESYGFSGILLDRKGYADRGEQLLAELAAGGWPMEFEQGLDNEWVFIRLSPAENPVLPTLTPYALSAKK